MSFLTTRKRTHYLLAGIFAVNAEQECSSRMNGKIYWYASNCGHSVELERYGMEDDEEYEALYPTREEVAENLTKIK